MTVSIHIENDLSSSVIDLTNGGILQYISGTFVDTVNPDYNDKEVNFQTIAKGTGAQIRTAIEGMERLLDKAIIWVENKTRDESVWLKVRSNSSTKYRRTLLKAWSRVDDNAGPSDPLFDKSYMLISTWTFTRHHCWEALLSDYVSKTIVNTSMNSGGAMAGTTTTQAPAHDGFHWADNPFMEDGTKPGRIITDLRFLSGGVMEAADKSWDRCWLGMKHVRDTKSSSDRWRANGNFQDAYGMTKIDTNVDGAKVDANALNGLCCEVDFSASPGINWAPRAYNDIPHSFHESGPGTYLVLFRAKVTAGTIARVGMFHAWDNINTQGGVADHYDDVYIEDDEWHMYEMGVIQVPQGGYRAAQAAALFAGSDSLQENVLGFSAERINGSGSLFVDYCTWIPQEYSLTGSNIMAQDLDFLQIASTEEDEVHAYAERWTPFHLFAADIATKNFYFPVAVGDEFIMVVVGDTYFGDLEHPLDVRVDLAMTLIPRYHSYNAD